MSHPVDIFVGKRLRMRRAMLGMSQQELGQMVGVTFQQIQKYERGVNRVGSSRLYEFCRVLGAPVSYFFDGVEEELPTGAMPGVSEATQMRYEAQPTLTKDAVELLRAYQTIQSPKIKKKVLDLVCSMAEAKATEDA